MDDTIASLRSNGLAFHNCPAGITPSDTSTIIVVGVARSGTSMVAKCLREMGVFIGTKADQAVHEDVEIARALESGDVRELKRLISERDSAHTIWGFKRPGAFKLINRFVQHFRNPRFVITFRDPVAIAKRNEISMQMDFMKAFRLATYDLSELTNFVDETTVPVMMVSYEKSLQEPRQFVEALARFCGTIPAKDVIDRAIQSIENGPAIYLNASRVRFAGRLDQVSDGFAVGWARRIGQTHPLTVVIMAGQEIVGRGSADLLREDLKETSKGDGKCAFRIKLSRTDLNKDDVIAIIEGSRFQLNK